ncbi:MAG: signal recognition particle protein [bacterium]
MFEVLSDRFSKIFSRLSKKNNLNENNIAEALSDIKKALLASDVAFGIVKDFIDEVKTECIGRKVFQNVKPGQLVVKIVYDKLVEILGGEESQLSSQRPLKIMMIGLQGSGKTTASAKLALWLKNKGERPALVACDIYRPAAIDQLKILGEQIDVPVLAYGQIPVKEIAQKAMQDAKNANYTVVIFDTAGRLQIDEPLIDEVKELKAQVQPQEILLVLDGALGQEAVNISKTFNDALALTGVIMTKLDGDAKGGAALSMKRAVNLPIKFSGVGEKIEDFEKFHPDRMASRILGMGDIVSLVEKAEEELGDDVAENLTQRLLSGDFNFDDFLLQIQQMKKLGSRSIFKWLPNLAIAQNIGTYDEDMKRCESFLLSMTKQERQHPNLLTSSYRRARITQGAGQSISEFNKFIKRYQSLKKIAQKLKKADMKKLQGMLNSLSGNAGFLRDQDLFKK